MCWCNFYFFLFSLSFHSLLRLEPEILGKNMRILNYLRLEWDVIKLFELCETPSTDSPLIAEAQWYSPFRFDSFRYFRWITLEKVQLLITRTCITAFEVLIIWDSLPFSRFEQRNRFECIPPTIKVVASQRRELKNFTIDLLFSCLRKFWAGDFGNQESRSNINHSFFP